MEIPVKKPRLEWLDALRGFTMILVVANHVSQMGFEQNWKWSSSLPFLLLFRMPLFFFVSGFLAYKAAQVWDAHNLGQLLVKKLKVQIIPTVSFFLLFCAMMSPNFVDAVVTNFHSATKGGETCFLPKIFPWAQGFKGENIQWIDDLSLGRVFIHFPFFLYGNIVHRYWDKAQRVMDSKWFYPLIIVLVIMSTLDVLKWHNLRFAWTNLPSTIAKFGLLTIVFMYFRNYQQYFTKLTVIGASLQYIGRRTLDIYLIHFFFMPNVPAIGMFFDKYRHNFALDTTISVLMALLIIGFCIISSNILRVSPFFKKWLFGSQLVSLASRPSWSLPR